MERRLAWLPALTGPSAAIGYGSAALGLAATLVLVRGHDASSWLEAVLLVSALFAAAAAGFASRVDPLVVTDNTETLTEFAAIAAEVGDGTWDYDIVAGTVSYSRACATMLGYEPDTIPSLMSRWGMLVHNDDLAEARAALDRYLDGADDEYRVNVRMRRKDGDWMHVVDSGRIVSRAADGRPRRMIGIHHAVREPAPHKDLTDAIGTDLDHALAGLVGHSVLAKTSDAATPAERAAWKCAGLAQRLRLAVATQPNPSTATNVEDLASKLIADAERWTSRRVALSVSTSKDLPAAEVATPVLECLLALALDEAIARTPPGGGSVELALSPLVAELSIAPCHTAAHLPHRMRALESLAQIHGIGIQNEAGRVRLSWPEGP